MTKKDYELIASILKGAQNYEATFNDNEKGAKAIEGITHTFATMLAHTNPRFDRARFLTACGVN
jgi:hypothetical protein